MPTPTPHPPSRLALIERQAQTIVSRFLMSASEIMFRLDELEAKVVVVENWIETWSTHGPVAPTDLAPRRVSTEEDEA